MRSCVNFDAQVDQGDQDPILLTKTRKIAQVRAEAEVSARHCRKWRRRERATKSCCNLGESFKVNVLLRRILRDKSFECEFSSDVLAQST